MALALTKFMFTLSLIGARDRERTKTFEILASGVDDATKRSNAQTHAGKLLTEFGAISNSHIQRYQLSEVWYDDAAVPANLNNIYEEVAVTCALDAGGGKKATINIPAPDDGIFVGDSGNTDDVDTADTALLAFVGGFANDGTELGALSDGEQFESPVNVLSARFKSVKSGQA